MQKFNMNINLEETSKTLLVKLSGDIEQEEKIQSFRDSVDEKLESEDLKKLAFDLAETVPSDLLIGFLVGRYKIAHKRGIETTIAKSSERVDKILNLSGITQIIPKEDGMETGI